MNKFLCLLIVIFTSGLAGWLLSNDYPAPDVSMVSAEMWIVLGIFNIILSLIISIS